MIRKFLMASMVAGAFAISACNTVQGVGEDISSAGECGEDVIKGGDC
ncbi:entericidin A/B family lipoprotein [Sphingomicrobium aestuariivivum]|nr:entericidin A/B family lipoprotein [Sphingomicrobium aestuariivivum]MCJ8190510.1 entericidin A/B family lipoprotein [Sphingomicrobium aestuariivivum]